MLISLRRAAARVTLGVALAGALLAAGCGGDDDNQTASGGGGTDTRPSVAPDAALAAKLPAKIKSAGTVKVATDASYAPNEFFDKDNKTIIGMDIDLGNAIGDVLGVKFQFQNTSFDGIIAALGSRYDLGMSSFTDSKEREKVVDMVTYFSAGTSAMVKQGNPAKITSVEQLCGKRAAAQKGTVQLDDLNARTKQCTSAGQPAIQVQGYPDQNAANLALNSGRADVVLADSPVIDYAVKQSNGAFEVVGQAYDTAPYGIAVPKTAGYEGFAEAILGAVKKLMADGTYRKILEKWGVQSGAISNPTVNGAVS